MKTKYYYTLAFILFSVIIFSFNQDCFSQNNDSTKIYSEKLDAIENNIKKIENKLENTQKDVFDAFNKNIQTMVDAHKTSQNHLNTIYKLIYGFFALILVVLSTLAFFGIKTYSDIKKYTRERIESLISSEIDKVEEKAHNKLKELGIDNNFTQQDIKDILEKQNLFYNILQLQGTDLTKENALEYIIYDTEPINPMLELILTKLANEKLEKKYIQAKSCLALICGKNVTPKSIEMAYTTLRVWMREGNKEEKEEVIRINERLKEFKKQPIQF